MPGFTIGAIQSLKDLIFFDEILVEDIAFLLEIEKCFAAHV